MSIGRRHLALVVVLIAILALIGCAPGNERWNPGINPGSLAGFWAGVWHGLIIVITFVVSLFTKDVGLYEVNNTGWPYNLGFLLGASASLGGGIRFVWKRRRTRERRWEKIGDRIEERIRNAFGDMKDETWKEDKKKEWDEIANKVQEKVMKALREWADKDE
jgi:hypothetical protein